MLDFGVFSDCEQCSFDTISCLCTFFKHNLVEVSSFLCSVVESFASVISKVNFGSNNKYSCYLSEK